MTRRLEGATHIKPALRRLVDALTDCRRSALVSTNGPIPTRSLLAALLDADRLNRPRAHQLRHVAEVARQRANAVLDAARALEAIADAEDSDQQADAA